MTASEARQLYLRMCNKGFAKTESWKPGFYFYSVNIPLFDDWAFNNIALAKFCVQQNRIRNLKKC